MTTRAQRVEKSKVNSAVISLRDMCYLLDISYLNDVRSIDIIQAIAPEYEGREYLKAIKDQDPYYADLVQLAKVYQDMKAAARKIKQLTGGRSELIRAFLKVQGIPSRK